MSRRRNAAAPVDNLDYEWVLELQGKRRAQASMVAVVKTKDRERFGQLLAVLATYDQHSLYAFDPWQGLRQRTSDSGQWETIALETGAYSPDEPFNAAPSLSELPIALRHMDSLLKSHPTLLVLKDIEGSNRNDVLQYALRSWALDPQALSRNSLIVLISAQPMPSSMRSPCGRRSK